MDSQDIDIPYQQSLMLLQHVMNADEKAVASCVCDHGISANISFDGISLLAIAAAQQSPFNIIRNLVEFGGANAAAYVKAPVKQIGLPPAIFHKDPAIETYLADERKKTLEWDDAMGMRPQAPVNYTLGQFSFGYETCKLPFTEAYTDPNHVRNALRESDNILPIMMEPDRMACLLENRRALYNQTGVDTKTLVKIPQHFEYN